MIMDFDEPGLLEYAALVVFMVIMHNVAYFLWLLLLKLTTKPTVRGVQEDPSDPYSAWVKPEVSDSTVSERHELAEQSSTVTELFEKVVEKYSQQRCFGFRPVFRVEEEPQTNGRPIRKLTLCEYKWQSYSQVFRSVRTAHLGFSRVGIKAGDVVMVYADTRLEWMVSCQALFRLGATVGTLFTNLGEEGIVHAINETEVTHLITNTELLTKINKHLDKLPNIRVIICITDGYQLDPNLNNALDERHRQRVTVYSFREIQGMGKLSLDSDEDKPAKLSPDSTAVLMYTSGSTGVPKGVLISHKNLLHTIKAFYRLARVIKPETDVYAAFLPLAHILEICAELCIISVGVPVGYASVQTLTDKSPGLQKGIKGDLTTLRPTLIVVVPLLLERIRNGIVDELSHKPLLAKLMVYSLLKYKSFWTKHGFETPFVDRVVCHKVKAVLGGRVRFIICGGAYLNPHIQEFVGNMFDAKVVQGFGLTETTASATLSDLDDLNIGHVGHPSTGVRVKLVDWTEGGYTPIDKPHPRGEIVIGGECVTNGYFKRPELNDEYYKTDENGIKWFYSGDIGEVLPSGVIRIIDRKKDIIKLGNGEYISLSKIEEELKQNPLVDNICVYGNQNTNFLIALIIPNLKALQKLIENGHKRDGKEKSLKDYCSDPLVSAKVYEKVCSATNLSRVELPTKIKLCGEEWLPDNGLVTASFKLKRKAIEHFYRRDIKRMLKTENNNNNSK